MEELFYLLDTGPETRKYPDKDVLHKLNSMELQGDMFAHVANLITKETDPDTLFSKLKNDTISADETIMFLNYVFRKILKPTKEHYFSRTLVEEHDPHALLYDTESEREILDAISLEEGDIITDSRPYGPADISYYTYSCNEKQYKNRICLKEILNIMTESPFLATPEEDEIE